MRRTYRVWITFVLASACLAANPALAGDDQGVVNINTAGAEQLMLLPRIGAAVAQRIVDFREKNGRFKAAEDLMLVQGIGERTFELIKPHIAVSGETTLTEKVKIEKG